MCGFLKHVKSQSVGCVSGNEGPECSVDLEEGCGLRGGEGLVSSACSPERTRWGWCLAGIDASGSDAVWGLALRVRV